MPLLATAQQPQPSLQPQPQPLLQPQPQPLLQPQPQPLLQPQPQLPPQPPQQQIKRIRMMIHQQPPPKPLVPQHMICHLTKNFPGHGDRLGRRARRGAGAEPRAPVSGSYYAGDWKCDNEEALSCREQAKRDTIKE